MPFWISAGNIEIMYVRFVDHLNLTHLFLLITQNYVYHPCLISYVRRWRRMVSTPSRLRLTSLWRPMSWIPSHHLSMCMMSFINLSYSLSRHHRSTLYLGSLLFSRKTIDEGEDKWSGSIAFCSCTYLWSFEQTQMYNNNDDLKLMSS